MKAVIQWLCLLVFCVVSISACGDRRTDEQRLEDALANVAAGEYRAASVDLKNILRNDPRNATARIALGQAMLELGDFAAAEKELSRANELGADPNDYMVHWARALMMTNAFPVVLAELRPELITDPAKRAIVTAYRGSATYGIDPRDADAQAEANAIFDRVIAGDASPEAVRLALVGKAELERARGNPGEAERLVRRSLDVVADSVDSTVALGSILLAQQKWDEAERVYAYGRSELNPNPLQEFLLHTGQITAMLGQNRIEEGAAEADKLAAAGNKHPLVGYLRGRAAFQAGDAGKAIEILQEAHARSQGDPRIESLLGAAHLSMKNYEQAEMFLSSALNKQPGNTMVTQMLAETRLAMQRPDAAEAAIRDGLRSSGPNAALLALLGRSTVSQGEEEEGLRYLEQARASDPDNVQIALALSSAYLGAGRFDDATALLNSIPEGAIEPQRREVLLAVAQFDRENPRNSYGEIEALMAKWGDDPAVLGVVGSFYVAAEDDERALEVFTRVLEIDPYNRSAIFSVGRIDDRRGEFSRSKQYLDRYLEENPRDVPALLARSRIAEREGDAQRAEDLVVDAHNADPAALLPNLILAGKAIAADDFETAKSYAQFAVNNHPSAVQAHSTMAVVQSRTNQRREALTSINRAIELQPDHAPFYYYRGRLEKSLDMLAQARQSFVRAVELDPANDSYARELVLAELRAGNTDRARELADNMVAAAPGEAAPLELKGDVSAALQDYSSAIALYNQAKDITPTARLAAKLYRMRSLNGSSNAFTSLVEWLEANPDDAATRLVLAQEYQRKGRLNQSIQQYEMVLEMAPESPLALNNLAWSYFERGSADDMLRAQELARRARELEPEIADIADTYGWILVRSGQIEAGTQVLREALLMSSIRDKPDIAYHLAAALNEAGESGEAKQILGEALASGATFSAREEARALYETL